MKAFVDLTLSPSVRQGTQHLLRITGLGKLYVLTVTGTDNVVAFNLHPLTLVLLSSRWHEAKHAGFGFLRQLHS